MAKFVVDQIETIAGKEENVGSFFKAVQSQDCVIQS